MQPVRDTTSNLRLLSQLLLASPLAADNAGEQGLAPRFQSDEIVSGPSLQNLRQLEALASSNHVIMRSFVPLQTILEAQGNAEGAESVANAVQREQARINHALSFLRQICATLEKNGCPVLVIKSLDHWPDLGSDLDLYTSADASNVVETMSAAFQAKLADRSWGDRLANKWNFIVPGLPELVEIHVGRLGQTGEQTIVSQSVTSRAREVQVGTHLFQVPAPEDRIIISTLQRMYRHFYIRLCDVVDNARLMDAGVVDYGYLRSLGSTAGLWEGIATYMAIISGYVEAYRGHGVPLPAFVTDAAKFGTEQVRFRRDFLRVSILPHSVRLYASELKNFLARGDFRNGFRLSLLPGLATAAALEQKITGSDKGIW